MTSALFLTSLENLNFRISFIRPASISQMVALVLPLVDILGASFVS